MRKLEQGELTLTLQTFSIAAAIRDVLQSCSMGLHQGAAGLQWVNEAEADTLPALIEVLLHCASVCALASSLTHAVRDRRT